MSDNKESQAERRKRVIKKPKKYQSTDSENMSGKLRTTKKSKDKLLQQIKDAFKKKSPQEEESEKEEESEEESELEKEEKSPNSSEKSNSEGESTHENDDGSSMRKCPRISVDQPKVGESHIKDCINVFQFRRKNMA